MTKSRSDRQPEVVPGRLYLCATPIGNLGDASERLRQTLTEVDVVYAEDTRRSGRLLAALEVSTPTRSFFTGNERRRSTEMEADLEAGRMVALVTDAGTPSVSDPGRLAVAAARRAGAEVIVIPGPSAVTAAVAGSGMVDGPFAFDGFLARKGTDRRRQLADLATQTRPTVLFLSPHRLAGDLADLTEACGEDRQVCVGRELTKLHEELWWGSLGEAVDHWSGPGRGEFVMVLDGAVSDVPDMEAATAMARRLIEEGASVSQASKEAAAATGARRREIYQALLR